MHILHVLNALENTPGEHVEGVDPLDKVGFDPWRLLLFNASQGGLDFLHCLAQHRLPFSTLTRLDGPTHHWSDFSAEKASSGCQEIPASAAQRHDPASLTIGCCGGGRSCYNSAAARQDNTHNRAKQPAN